MKSKDFYTDIQEAVILNRPYSIMLKMGMTVTGLEKGSYKSFALEADLSVWLSGTTLHWLASPISRAEMSTAALFWADSLLTSSKM